MPRKIAPTKKQLDASRRLAESPDQRSEFSNALALLPEGEDALVEHAAWRLEQYSDARQCGDAETMSAAELFYWAAVWRLNGDTVHGCKAPGGGLDRIQKRLASAPGVPTLWGQRGDWLLEVDGMRLWVRTGCSSLGGRHGVDLRAVDADAPFLNVYGLLNVQLWPDDYPGLDFVRALRAKVEALIAGDHPPVEIETHHRAGLYLPDWLAPALDGVTRNGQQALALSGRAPAVDGASAAEPPKVPMSNRERQRLFRQRKREREQAAQAEGGLTLSLTARERITLANALDYYDFQCPHDNDWARQGRLDLYRRLERPHSLGPLNWPADEDRPAWYSRQLWHVICDDLKRKREQAESELVAARAEVARLQGLVGQITAELGVEFATTNQQIDKTTCGSTAPEAFSLQLLRRHKWKNGREEGAALVAVQVVPHEGQWMWAACLSSQNGSGSHYAALPKWGKFAATPGAALVRAVTEVRAFRERMTPAERKRLDAWLAGEVAERLAQLGVAAPVHDNNSTNQQMLIPLKTVESAGALEGEV